MVNLHNLPGRGAGGGPVDPMLEKRVEVVEDAVVPIRTDLAEMKTALKDLADGQVQTREDIAYLRGLMSRMPGPYQLWLMVVTTWIAGAGIVMAAVQLART